jgi:hypothetical protein
MCPSLPWPGSQQSASTAPLDTQFNHFLVLSAQQGNAGKQKCEAGFHQRPASELVESQAKVPGAARYQDHDEADAKEEKLDPVLEAQAVLAVEHQVHESN